MKWTARLTLGAALLAAPMACKRKDEAVAPDALAKLSIVVRATPDSNGGRPVYVVVRAIDEQGFDVDGYSEVTALVTKPDPTVLAKFMVFPGRVVLEEVELDELPETVAVYCLFTETMNDRWKLMFSNVDVIDVNVSANEIAAKH